MGKFSCDVNPKGDRYIFYEHIDKYLKYGNSCNNDNSFNRYGDKCEFEGLTYDGKEKVQTNICQRFKCLIHNILNEAPKHNSSIEKADGEYLNYWLNHEIHLRGANICPKNFYQNMKIRDPKNTLLPKLRNYMYYIEDDDVNNMYLLYHLYNNYTEMNKIINSDVPKEETFMVYAKNCVEKYKELKAKCSEKNIHLSNALNIFKTKYKETKLNKAKLPEWKIDNLPSLDDTDDIQEKATEPSNINISRVEITTKPSVSLGQPALRLSTFAATLADPAALMNQLAESGKSNHSPQNKSLQDGTNAITLDENGSTELKSEGDLSDYTRTIIGPAVGTIGMSSIFFIFYKFTSFGVWLFRGRRNNKNIRMNFDEQRNLFLDTSEYHHEYPSRESYNIAYNSA
ncbi:VIR protein [Plasmodium vivax]|uniref:VIR protein n=1 Tax=Plasmodium vivax TaxID=5855 RepID=A0A1G4ED12_PLAVI|nr:VIR protein [Plasmodium vivax]